MPAPAIAVLVGALIGGGGGWYGTALQFDRIASGVYVRSGEVCAGTDKAIDLLGDLAPKSRAMKEIVAVAARACDATKAPNTLPDRLAFAFAVVKAFHDAADKAVSKAAP